MKYFPELIFLSSVIKKGVRNKEVILNKSEDDKFLFCDHWKYKSKKENVLQKHKNDKHAIIH